MRPKVIYLLFFGLLASCDRSAQILATGEVVVGCDDIFRCEPEFYCDITDYTYGRPNPSQVVGYQGICRPLCGVDSPGCPDGFKCEPRVNHLGTYVPGCVPTTP